MQELLPDAKDSETKKNSVKNLLNSRFTFRLWQILVFLFVMTIIITVTGILAAKLGPASPCYKISTKEDRGNLTFLPLRHLAFSASILHSSRSWGSLRPRDTQCNTKDVLTTHRIRSSLNHHNWMFHFIYKSSLGNLIHCTQWKTEKTRGTFQSKPRQTASKTRANNLRVICKCSIKKTIL